MKKLASNLSPTSKAFSLNDLSTRHNKTIFVSSEICDKNPYVHHLYVRDRVLHYIVYDPCDDIVIEHISSESLPMDLFTSNADSSFNHFDRVAYQAIKPYCKAICILYAPKPSFQKQYLTKILEDVALIMNPAQILSAGYLVEIHNLGNSLASDNIKLTLSHISNACMSLISDVEFDKEQSFHQRYLKQNEAVDEVIFAIMNETPISLEKIERFTQAVLSKPILNKLNTNKAFRDSGGIDYIDLLLGSNRFTQDPLFVATFETKQ